MTFLPNFFIIGAAKAATTSLSSLLRQHPEAAIAKNKEPHFFSVSYRKGWDYYADFFKHCSGAKAIGDASTSYSRIRQNPEVIGRIKRAIPDAKIIYMVRHPLERIESAYVEHLCSPKVQLFESINDAVIRQPMLVNSSRYWEVFSAYRDAFGESRIMVIWFEDYISRTGEIFRDVCRFLEIDDGFIPDLNKERTNSRTIAAIRMAKHGRDVIQINTQWDRETRMAVINQIRDDNCRFLAHFGRPKNYWGDFL